MRVGRYGLAILVVVGVAVPVAGVAPAEARVPKITGGVRCTISNGLITFNPALRNKIHIEGKQTGRGPSAASFTADLSDCTDPSAGPAPAGIDHGTLSGTGRVGGSYCDKLGKLKLKSTVDWRKADETVVGSTTVKLALTIVVTNFQDPRTVTFAGTAKGRSSVFPKDPVSFTLLTTASNDSISMNCFKLELPDLGLQSGTFAADPPAA